MFGAACFSPCKLRVLFSLMARHPTFLSTWLAVSFQFPSMCEKYYKLIFFLSEVTASMLSKLSASLWQSIAGSLEHGLQAYPFGMFTAHWMSALSCPFDDVWHIIGVVGMVSMNFVCSCIVFAFLSLSCDMYLLSLF